MSSRFPSLLLCLAFLAGPLAADPLSRKTEIDFYRDVPSRNLKGLATRSDGRLVAGPTLVELAGAPPADLLWCLEAAGETGRFFVGTGPEGRIFEVKVDAAAATFTSRELIRLEDPQVFALRRLPNGDLLAGTSPKGALCLVRDGQLLARTLLPADSIFDLVVSAPGTALVGTGNPGRIYQVDLARFAASGVHTTRVTDPAVLAERGLTLFGQIRDRNVRRLAPLPDGRVAAGSSPRGNVYLFPREAGGAPTLLQENRDAEVTDLLPLLDGDLLATIVHAPSTGEARIIPSPLAPKPGADPKDTLPPASQPERFGGRSTLLRFPARGFVETLSTRANTAFYRLARRDHLLIVAGGEQGELAGYDLATRHSLWFAGSASSQLNHLLPFGGAGLRPDRFLVLRNNAPGFALLDFTGTGRREAETRRLDLPAPAQLGALRFNRLRELPAAALDLAVRTSNGTDEVEGWSPWTPLTVAPDQGWRAEALRGRYLKLRLAFDAPAGFEIDRASIFTLPQNRRPQLQEFRVLAPGYGIIPAAEPTPSASLSLSQLLQGAKDEDRRRSQFLTSQVVPSPGVQVVLWTLLDPDGDTLVSTFSLRRDGDEHWTEIVSATRDAHAQFNTRHLPDGVYFTRLVVSEVAPRPADERLTHTFETDDLVIDHTAPEILAASARRTGDSVIVTVHGRDQLSLLEGMEVVFSNNVRESVEHPLDGVRDGRDETFVLEVPLARVAGATSVEMTLLDQAGNGTARRLTW